MIKQIEIDRPGAGTVFRATSRFGFDPMKRIVQAIGLEGGVEVEDGIHEARLSRIPHRIGLVERGDTDAFRVRDFAQGLQRGDKMSRAILDVAPQPNERRTHRRLTISTSAEDTLPAKGTLGFRMRTRTSWAGKASRSVRAIDPASDSSRR